MQVFRVMALFGMMLISVLGVSASAGVTFDRFRLDGGYKEQSLFCGDDYRGRPGTTRWGIFADAQHRRLFALMVETNDYTGVKTGDLSKDGVSIAMGAKAPFTPNFAVRVVYNHTTEYGSNESIDLFGVYPEFKAHLLSDAAVTLGYEHNAVHMPELTYAFVQNNWSGQLTTMVGVSASSPFSRGQRVSTIVTGGAIVKFSRLWVLGGVADRTIDGTISFTTGLAWPSRFTAAGRFDTAGLNPGALVVFRQRPGTEYTLALFALKARGINSHVAGGIFPVMNQGLLSPVRVMNNRNFDVGVGGGYKEHEFGTTVLTATHVKTEIMPGVSIHAFEAGLYQTVPWGISSMRKSYVGVIVSDGSEVRFDFRTYRLVSESHRNAKLLLGSYWPVGNSRLDLSGSLFFWGKLEGAGLQFSLVL